MYQDMPRIKTILGGQAPVSGTLATDATYGGIGVKQVGAVVIFSGCA